MNRFPLKFRFKFSPGFSMYFLKNAGVLHGQPVIHQFDSWGGDKLNQGVPGGQGCTRGPGGAQGARGCTWRTGDALRV